MRGRGGAAGALSLAAVLVLAGCAPTADPDVVDAAARAVFADLTGAAAATDPAILRTLEVAEEAEQECAEPAERQRSLLATGTLSVEAVEADGLALLETLGAVLDPARWDPIGVGDPSAQRAWADDDGIVASLTASGSVLAIVVFTPCRAA